jgi:hypothetical protein
MDMAPSNPSWASIPLGVLKSTGIGILSFFTIFAVNTLLGLAVTLAIIIGAWSDPIVASILGLVAFTAMLISAAVLSFKRSITVACVHALRTTDIAPITINFIFQGLLPDESQTHGDRGHLATKASERLPLRQCEDALKSRIQNLLSQPPEQTGLRAWVMRLIQAALLKTLAKLTLAHLRREDSSHGGVDLQKVRQALIHEAQVTLPEKLGAKIRLATLLGLTLPPVLAALAALTAYWILVRYLGA